jgi:2-oxoisovalerate dehydrogenase E1 component alpha subunit
MIRYLDARGEILQPLPPLARDIDLLRSLYRLMVQTRTFDHKAIALQRTGQIGTYASCLGQEAVGAGVGTAMRREDVLLPTYRQYAAQIQRGLTMTELLAYWGGDERGMAFFRGEAPAHDFPICVPIASHAPHAVGVAYAFQLRHEPRVAVCVLGDGATSKGDFYEAINAAGVWQLPVVFVVENNGWAISVPASRQTHAETLAQKAVAAGIPGLQVDGNDVIAVCHVAGEAIEGARRGEGPTLIEALTYRLGDHTTADDASRYRDPAELDAQRKNDPISRLQTYLRANGLWTDEDESALDAECTEAVEHAAQAYLDMPPQSPQSMFEHLYARPVAAFAGQAAELAARDPPHG